MPAKLPAGRIPLKGRNIDIDATLYQRLERAADDSGKYKADIAKTIIREWIDSPLPQTKPAAIGRVRRAKREVPPHRLFLRTDDETWKSLVKRAAIDDTHLHTGFENRLRSWLDEHAPVWPSHAPTQRCMDLLDVVSEAQAMLSKLALTLASLADD